jgi:hypothetical protein
MAPSKEEARKYKGRIHLQRPKLARTRTQYFPFWFSSTAHAYAFLDPFETILVLMGKPRSLAGGREGLKAGTKRLAYCIRGGNQKGGKKFLSASAVFSND